MRRVPPLKQDLLVYEAGRIRVLRLDGTAKVGSSGTPYLVWADGDEVIAGANPTHWRRLPGAPAPSDESDVRTCQLCGQDAVCYGDPGGPHGPGFNCGDCCGHSHTCGSWCILLDRGAVLADMVDALLDRLTTSVAEPGDVDRALLDLDAARDRSGEPWRDAVAQYTLAVRSEERGRWFAVDYAAKQLIHVWLQRNGPQSSGSYFDRRRLADLARALGADVSLWDERDGLRPEGWDQRVRNLVEFTRSINRSRGLPGGGPGA